MHETPARSTRSRPHASDATRTRDRRDRRRAARSLAVAGARGLLALALACGVGCGGDEPPPVAKGRPKPTATPSVALIDVSGLRREDVFPVRGAAGSSAAPVAPSVRRFFDGAASFSQAAATSDLAAASLASVFTGYTPHDSGFSGSPDASIPDSVPTLLGGLDREGYATAAFVRSTAVTAVTLGLSAALESKAWKSEKTVATASVDAVAWLASRPKDRPFGLFVVLEPETRGDPAAVAAADRAAGAVLEALRAPTSPKDLVTIVFSDHGDAASPPPSPSPSAPSERIRSLRRLSDERIRVPLAVAGQGFLKGDVTGSCSLADLSPTVRDLMGLPATTGLYGRTLRPLAAKPDAPGRPVVAQTWLASDEPSKRACLYAVRDARSKLVAVFTSTPPAGWTEEVYDLVADADEGSPLGGTDDVLTRFGVPFQVEVKALRAALGGKSNDHDTIKPPYTGGIGPCGGH